MERLSKGLISKYPKVIEYGLHNVSDQPVHFIIQQLVLGETAQERLAGGSTFSPTEVASIGISVMEGLEKLHDLDFVHTSLDVDTIRFGAAGEPYITGLGSMQPLEGEFTSLRDPWKTMMNQRDSNEISANIEVSKNNRRHLLIKQELL